MMKNPVRLAGSDVSAQDRYRIHIRRAARRLIDMLPSPPVPDTGRARFVICGMGRNGSTLLAESLNASPDITCDGEILNGWVNRPRKLIANRVEGYRDTVYGFKLLSYQISDVQGYMPPDVLIDWLIASGFRTIYVRRRNILKHIISQISARHTAFHIRSDTQRQKIRVEEAELTFWKGKIEARLAFEARLFTPARCSLTAIYEDDIAPEDRRRSLMAKTAAMLDVPDFEPRSTLVRFGADQLAEQVENYAELERWARRVGYTEHLDPPAQADAG